jgi:hypothetical protein
VGDGGWSMSEPLGGVIEAVTACAARGRLPVVVFDLDSTLIDAAVRHLRILLAFAEQRGDEALRSRLAGVVLSDFGWTVDGPLRAQGYRDEAALAALRAYWAEKFFSAEYADVGRPTAGAVGYVQAVSRAGALVYYLSARVGPVTGVGTARLLQQCGFPLWDGRSVLHLKPGAEVDDGAFKRSALDAVRALRGEVVATFENEPGHANVFRAAFPGARSFLVGSVHSPDAPAPHPEVVRVQNFVR